MAKSEHGGQPSFYRRFREIDESKREYFLTLSEKIESSIGSKGYGLDINEFSLVLGGNNYSFEGNLQLHPNKETTRVKVKISLSPRKAKDLKREIYMLNKIKDKGHPAPEIYYFGDVDLGNYFYVREYIEGEQVRNIRGENPQIFDAILDFFVDIHSDTSVPGFGFLHNINGLWRAISNSWIDALMEKAQSSYRRATVLGLEIELRLVNIIKANEYLIDVRRGSLLHGDGGLINFLGREGRLVGILDPEFAVIGDPAYEFSDKVGRGKDYSIEFINRYFNQMISKGVEIHRETFFERGVVYSPLIVMDIVPNLLEAGNKEGAEYFLSILLTEIKKAEVLR